MASTAILVLAGGRSRRMGRDKAHLEWKGSTLLAWQKQRLATLGWPVEHSGPEGIADITPGYPGPLGGLQAALASLPDVAVWVLVPVDMPAIRPDSVRRLAVEAARVGVPVAFRDCPLPLAVPVNQDLRTTLDRWLADADGPRSLFRLHQHGDGDWLEPVPDANELINLNTPEDWRRFQRHNSRHAGEHHG